MFIGLGRIRDNVVGGQGQNGRDIYDAIIFV
jgi:hypothetical protein